MSDSLQRLEGKIAYLERHVVEQDKVMLELAETLERLKGDLAGIRARFSETGDTEGSPGGLTDERPPHY
jgi:SlyX protein|uniref:SlyX family protein n=1 Tax=Cephaloticoccus sp. TaxID=1985742 RepID=UPI00404B1514